MYLLTLGDSIGAGVGASLPSSLGYAALLHRNAERRWPAFVRRDVATTRPALKFVNLAESGATTARTLARLQSSAGQLFRHRGQEPGIVVITAGGNDLKNVLWEQGLGALAGIYDLLMGRPLQQTLDNLIRTVSLVRHPSLLGPNAAIYLATVYDPTDGTGIAQLPWGHFAAPGLVDALREWRHRYHAMARAMGITVVDALEAFVGHGMGMDASQRWLSDWLHPNDRGHHELRSLFWRAIEAAAAPR